MCSHIDTVKLLFPMKSSNIWHLQILAQDLLLSLGGVECEGDEESLLDCPRSSDADIQESYDDYREGFIGTVVACGNSTSGSQPSQHRHMRRPLSVLQGSCVGFQRQLHHQRRIAAQKNL